MPVSISGTNGVTFPDSSLQAAAASPYVLKNRIINGDMRIDQRNAGASVTGNNGVFPVDRYVLGNSQSSKCTTQQNAGSVTPPAGFTNYLGITSSSAYSILSSDFFQFGQKIEGYNMADLAWGTADAKTITLSFWVRSSLTGTFGGSIRNSADNYSYCYSYTISSANTWEYKTITIAGPTSGTWLTTNGLGIDFRFSYGMGSTYTGTAGSWGASSGYAPTGQVNVLGTNGATWYVTGVQIEQNTSATPFERRLYNHELAACQRYYYKIYGAVADRIALGHSNLTTQSVGTSQFPVTLRTAPTALEQSGTAADYQVQHANTATNCSAVPTFANASINMATSLFTVASGLTVGQGLNIRLVNTSGYLAWSAEL
jgi:hypothetical protein